MYVVNTFDSTPISNIYGIQGYAGFPTNPDSGYDTFMKASVVTNTSDPTTLPHEFGHSMGLHHPFNTGTTTDCPTVTSGGCATDNDLVCDTPSTKSLLGVNTLPANGSVNPCDAAGWNNVQYNVMNYTNSNRLFTLGQKDRAVASFLLSRLNLTKSLGGTALSGTPATVATTTCIPPTTATNTGDANFGPTKVVIGTINNSSQGSTTGNANKIHYDYTTMSCLTTAFKTNLAVSSNPQSLTLRCATNTNKFSAWIDYNNNGTFESGELIVTDENVAPDTDVPFAFSIPTTGVTLDTPLRMRVIADDAANSATPCGQRAFGQVEDYEVTITAVPLATENFDFSTLKVYPNPTANIVNIDFDKNIEEISVTNILGQTVLSKSINQSKTSIDLSNFAPATYFVKITTDGNSKMIKIVRQ
jgi:GEVED domain/Secretion system C-terminal sorting domain/Pregnancy-associated plasma protein-A